MLDGFSTISRASAPNARSPASRFGGLRGRVSSAARMSTSSSVASAGPGCSARLAVGMGGGLGGRKPDNELAALPGAFAARFDAAAVQQHDVAHDAQADAEAGPFLGTNRAEQLEDMRQRVG